MESQAPYPLAHPRIHTSSSDPSSPSRVFPFPSPNHPAHSPSTPPLDTGASPSALARHQLTRLLSPDLPTRDALYLFCNFSSYMRSPQEGAEGIKDNTDFHDTIRLLDYARTLGSNPHANVRVLHMKYRFQTPDQGLPTTRQGKLNALHYKEDRGRRNVTVPQPFSTLHDPVIKVDYQDNGVFNPLPSQAVFQHVSKHCQPPPRIIVVSYVGSKVTENHLSAIAAWAFTSTPPIYVFSPLETRLREQRPLNVALHHAIPISMYAWPVGASTTPSPNSAAIPGPYRARSQDGNVRSLTAKKSSNWSSSGRRASADSRALPSPATLMPEYSPRSYPPGPVATLSVLSDVYRAEPDAVGDRIPLWTLAPGAGILHGSTAVSLGIKLSDFSAVNLVKSIKEGDKGSQPQNQVIDAKILGIRTSPMDLKDGQGRVPKVSLPPLDAVARRSTAATPEPISRPGSAASSRKINGIRAAGDAVISGMTEIANANSQNGHPTIHLTPPRQDPTRLSPPDQRPPSSSLPLSQQSWPRTKSWPTTREKVPGWRRGRREVMEDALEEIGAGIEGPPGGGRKEGDGLTLRMRHLDVVEASPTSGLMEVDDVVLAALAGE